MKNIKITVRGGMALALMSVSVMALVSCGSSMGASQPVAKKQVVASASATSASKGRNAADDTTSKGSNASEGSVDALKSGVDGTAKSDGSTSKGRKAANK